MNNKEFKEAVDNYEYYKEDYFSNGWTYESPDPSIADDALGYWEHKIFQMETEDTAARPRRAFQVVPDGYSRELQEIPECPQLKTGWQYAALFEVLYPGTCYSYRSSIDPYSWVIESTVCGVVGCIVPSGTNVMEVIMAK